MDPSQTTALFDGWGAEVDYLRPLFDPDLELTASKDPGVENLPVVRIFEERLRPFVFPLEPLRYDPTPDPDEGRPLSAAGAEAEQQFWNALWNAPGRVMDLFPRWVYYGTPEIEYDSSMITLPSDDPDRIDRARHLRVSGRPVAAAFQYCLTVPPTPHLWLEALDALWEAGSTDAPRLFGLNLWDQRGHYLSRLSDPPCALKLLLGMWWWHFSSPTNFVEEMQETATEREPPDPVTFEDFFVNTCYYHYLYIFDALEPTFCSLSLQQGVSRRADQIARVGLLKLCKLLPTKAQQLPDELYRFLRRRLTWAVQQCLPYFCAPSLDLALGGLALDLPLSAVDLLAKTEEALQASKDACRKGDSPATRLSAQLCDIITMIRQVDSTEARLTEFFALATQYINTLRSEQMMAPLRDLVSALLAIAIDTPFWRRRIGTLTRAVWALDGDMGSVRETLVEHPWAYFAAYKLYDSAQHEHRPLLRDDKPLRAPSKYACPASLRHLRIGPDLPMGPRPVTEAYLLRSKIINTCARTNDPASPIYRLFCDANHFLTRGQQEWRLLRAKCTLREKYRVQYANPPDIGMFTNKRFQQTRNLVVFGSLCIPGEPSERDKLPLLMVATQRLQAMARDVDGLEKGIPPEQCFAKSALQYLQRLLHCLHGETVAEIARTTNTANLDLYLAAREAFSNATKPMLGRKDRTVGWLQQRARSGLLELEALMCRIGVLPGGAETFLRHCLDAERSLRSNWLATLAGELNFGTPLSIQRVLERQQSETIWVEEVQRLQVLSRSICLLDGRDIEAFWWQQRTKAALASLFVSQRRHAAVLLAMAYGHESLARPQVWRMEPDARETWKRLVSETTARHAPADITHSELYDQRRPSTALSTLTDFDSSRAVQTFLSQPEAGSAGIVMIDWTEDTTEDRFYMTVARPRQGVQHTSIKDITPSALKTWLWRYWQASRAGLWDPEWISHLRDLDPLVAPLEGLTQPNERFVFCPTGLLHQLPLHALWVRKDTPVISRNPVSYTANLVALNACESRSKERSLDDSEGCNQDFGIVSVYRPLSGGHVSPDFDEVQKGLLQSLSRLSTSSQGTLTWDRAVNKRRMADMLTKSKIMLFVGHCVLVKQPWDRIPSSHLILYDDSFSIADMLSLSISGSLVVLTACGSSTQAIGSLDEPLGLPTAALVAGAATVIGTMWPVSVYPAIYFSKCLFQWLADPSMAESDGMVNVAKAMQMAVLDVKKVYPNLSDWAGYVLHGSSRMKQRSPAAEGGADGLQYRADQVQQHDMH